MDVLIPVGPSDVTVVQECIKSLFKNVINLRRIIVVKPSSVAFNTGGVNVIDEQTMPFTMTDVIRAGIPHSRAGWYLQQLIKLHGDSIPDISDQFLVVDADTCLLRPISFTERTDDVCRLLFATGSEYHKPYFEHMHRMHQDFQKVHKRSGIAHHMVFDAATLREMRKWIERRHNMAFWQVFLKQVSPSAAAKSGASEYEMYFTYMHKFHSNRVRIRELRRVDVLNVQDVTSMSIRYDMAHCHYYKRM